MPIFMKLSEEKRLNIITNTCKMIVKCELVGGSFMILDTPSRLLAICNGLGAKDSSIRIPAKIWGTSILESTLIHDYMYEVGSTWSDKLFADKTFKTNMYMQIDKACKGVWYKPVKLMKWRANLYYQLVVKLGQKAFDQKVFPMNSNGVNV